MSNRKNRKNRETLDTKAPSCVWQQVIDEFSQFHPFEQHSLKIRQTQQKSTNFSQINYSQFQYCDKSQKTVQIEPISVDFGPKSAFLGIVELVYTETVYYA